MALKYKRVLLKLSGEALGRDESSGISYQEVHHIVNEIQAIIDLGVEVAVVVGGGNFFRGEASSSAGGLDRVIADYVGMLATVMNALVLQEAFRAQGIPARALSALSIDSVVEPYIRGKAIRYLEGGTTVIFAGGTGNPFFTTDTAAALRAAEIGADVVLKATKVDGIYSEDPHKCADVQRYEHLSFDEAIQKRLKVMDATAFSLCRDRNMPIVVFSIFQPKALQRIVLGEVEGTVVD